MEFTFNMDFENYKYTFNCLRTNFYNISFFYIQSNEIQENID